MIQNFDKVIKYDDHVSYFNIEIHKSSQMQEMCVFWVKMVRFGNSFVIFTTSKKNSNEIKDVLVKNFGLNLSVPKDSSRYIQQDNQESEVTDEDEIGNSNEKNPLIETRDSVPPLPQS